MIRDNTISQSPPWVCQSWRVISGGDQVYCPIEMRSSVWVNGAWHWLTQSGEHVVSLDASKEMFFYVRLPNPEMKHKYLLSLVVYEDCLAVFERVPPLISTPHHPRQLDIWLYKSEWRKHSFNMNSLEDQFTVQENSIASVQMDHYEVTLLDVGENRMPDYLKSVIGVGGNPIAFLKNGKVALLKGYQVRYAQFGTRFAYVRAQRESLLAYNVERGEKCIVVGQELIPKSAYGIRVFAHRKSLITWNLAHLAVA
ncbi:hypothetical protein QJS10_CPA06g00155 [Acorus calamus]|uniref:F-box associated beta-propeller type 1 domain-containing protein n=1 Tax=Acorus calamus TaxID=4465 RepID=A0AAV9EPW4_ACOCL|nr:hypothetical protein QJS10_CPA06g00155 [Acorus calamus]